MVTDILEHIKCCGCSACEQICARHAITMKYDQDGFIYPDVDKEICTNCNICDNVCPILNSDKVKNDQKQDAYVAINNNKNVLSKSSSGGVFSVIAEYVLSQGGVVCGAAFNEDLKVCHCIVDNVEYLDKLRGSKYIFSENNGCYKAVRDFLKKGRWVYFTGTGCQVAGLKSFLNREYENLITSDILCHGTPSYKMFRAFIDKYEHDNNVKTISYNFRDKTICGWSCSSSSYVKNNVTGKIQYIPYHDVFEGYFNAFISGSINRESCYLCEFTTDNRTGDITLADYWGVEKYHPEIATLDGVSFVLVNNTKGRVLWNKIKDKIFYEPTNPDWAAVINRNLRERTSRPARRNSVYGELKENPDKLIDSFMPHDYGKTKIKFYIKKILRSNDSLYRMIYKYKRH